MQNIWKRSLSMFLALVMIIGMLPMNALATETEETIMEETMMEETVLPETAETMPSAETVEAVEVTEEPVAETEAPAETAAETAPAEETEADTVPEETAAATIPVETVFEEEMPQQETPVGESAPGEALSEADFLRSLEMSIASGDQEYVLQDPVTISGHVTIPKDYTLRVCENGSLTVAEQAVLEVKGVLHLDNGSVTVHGTLDNIGELQDLGGVIADVGADDTVLTIGETGELINGGYFQMSAGALKLDGTFTYQGGLIFISSDLILSAEDEAKIGRENIIFDIFADSENDMIEGNILREGYQQQNVFVIGDVRVISLMELPASENFNLQVGYKTSRINVDIPGKLTIAVGAGLTVNNALYILDNGFVQIEEGARLVNNGRIGNLGTLLAYYNVENNGTMTGNPVENERDEQSDFEDILADCTGNDYVLTEPVTLIRDLTIDLQGGTFYIGQGGMITVPENVTLTVVGQMEVTAGKIIVLNGGLLECIDGHIQIRRGLVYFETGAGYNVRMSGPAYWEEKGDTEPRLTFYTVADEGSGVSPNWGNYRSGSTSLLPGWFMTGLFCFQEWDSVNYEWNMIFMDPQYLNCGEGLTMTRLKDMPNPGHILDGDKYGQKYVTIAADNVFDVDSYVAYNFGGEEYRLNVRIERPQEHAFYTDAYASNETFLNHISNCYEVDPLAEEHFFYYIFTAGGGWKVESFEVVNNPFENVPVEEVEWEQISDTVYKITIKPEVAANMPAGGFPVHVNVSVSNPDNGNTGRWGIGQLWCMPSDQGQNALEEELQDCVDSGSDYVLTNKVVLNRDLTVDLQGENFIIPESGMIIVPRGVTLRFESHVLVEGGKIIVLNGGRLETPNAPSDPYIQISNGFAFFETDASYDISMRGPAYWEANGDTATRLVAYGIMDQGSGVTPNWGNETTGNSITPGMAFSGLFCIRQWDEENYAWNRVYVDPEDLGYGEGLQVMALEDTPNPGHIMTGDPYGRKYTAIVADYVFDVDTYVSYDYQGETYYYDICIERPRNHGFYSAPEASNENYLGFHYPVNPRAEENAFYYIFTNEEGWEIQDFKVVYDPFAYTPVKEVTWEKISDTVYKIILKPEVVEKMDYSNGFPVHVEVKIYNPTYGFTNRWGIGQLWCQLPTMNQDALEGHLESCKETGSDWTQDAKTILDRDMTIDLGDRLFTLYRTGILVVPAGKTLTVNSDVRLEGGQILLQGGALVINGNVTIEEGSISLEEAGSIENNGHLINKGTITVADGTITGTGDLTTHLNGIDSIDRISCSIFYRSAVTTESALINAVTGGLAEVSVSGNITLKKALTIPADVTLIIEKGATLTVDTKTTFVNKGRILVNGALKITSTTDVENQGQLDVYGTMTLSTGKVWGNYGRTFVYAGGALEMSKGTLQGNRIGQIPDDSGAVGTIVLPEAYAGFYYTKGVAVESCKVEASKTVAPVGEEVHLFLTDVFPANAEFGSFTFKASNATEPDPMGIVTSTEPGTVTAVVYILDENGNETGIADSVDIEFVEQKILVTDTDGNAIVSAIELISGEKLSMTAQMDSNLTDTDVVWELADGSEDAVTLSVKKGIATITAKTLTEYGYARVTVRAEDGTAAPKVISLVIRPKAQKVELLDETGTKITGKTVSVDLNSQNTMILRSDVFPLDAAQDVTLTMKGDSIIESTEEIDDGVYELHFADVIGKTTVTVTAANGGPKASVTIKTVKLLRSIAAEVDGMDLIGGQKETVYALDETGERVKNTLVEWYLCDESGHEIETHPYMTITAKGKLTTKTVAAPGPAYIRARVIGNEEAMTKVVEIRLYPAITQAEATVNGSAVDGTQCYDLAAPSAMCLGVNAYPSRSAVKSVKWSRPSKSASIADIDPDTGVVTAAGASGTVTFTGTITMWNGKTKQVKVNVLFDTIVHDLVFYSGGWEFDNEGQQLILHGGEDYMPIHMVDTLDKNQNPVDADLTWSLADAADKRYLTVKNGVFSVKAVDNPAVVDVVVASDDGFCRELLHVLVLPKQDQQGREALLLNDGSAWVTETTLLGQIGAEFELTATDYLNYHGAATWTSDDEDVALVDDNGRITVVGEGTATITAAAEDGRTAIVKVKGSRVSVNVAITSQSGSTTVASGKNLTLVGTVTYSDTKTNTSVNWSVSDPALAKISSKGVLTAAANLTEPAVVTVTAAAKDGLSSAQMNVSILPQATGVTILDKEYGENITNAVMTLFVGESMDLHAEVFPDAAFDKVIWGTNSTKVIRIDKETGELTCLKAGTATITATAADGSGKKVSFKITVVQPMAEETLDVLAEEIWGIGGGKKLKLAGAIKIPSGVTNKKLTWEIIGGEGAAYASISSSGVLTTKAVSEAKELRIRVTAAQAVSAVSGDATASCEFTVTIYPAATAVRILDDDGVTVNNKTLNIFVGDTLNLNAAAKPGNAWNEFDWTSSKSSQATVENGVVTGLAAGAGKTVTITAAAKDGSGKKATVKVKILRPVESIDFHEDLFIAGGKTLKLAGKVIFNAESGTKPTIQTLKWRILEGGEYATINTKGELKAKKVQVEKTVHIEAVSTDGSNVVQDCYVTIYPAVSKVRIYCGGTEVTGKTLTLYQGDAEAFEVKLNPSNALQQWTWSSSDKKGTYVWLNAETGEVAILKGGKTVTLTATAADGSGVKATVKIKTR